MQLEVYTDHSKEKIVTLGLVKNRASGSIELGVVDENGEIIGGGYLLSISKCGIDRKSCISNSFGFELNEKSQIRLIS